VLKSSHGLKNRDGVNATRHFASDSLQGIPFELHIPLPPPRKWRIIGDRDDFGRIIHSQPPNITL
jgi:hypothetical protein